MDLSYLFVRLIFLMKRGGILAFALSAFACSLWVGLWISGDGEINCLKKGWVEDGKKSLDPDKSVRSPTEIPKKTVSPYLAEEPMGDGFWAASERIAGLGVQEYPGRRVEETVWRTPFKYPLLVRTRVYRWDSAEGRWIGTQEGVRVGTHVLVRASRRDLAALPGQYRVHPVLPGRDLYRVEDGGERVLDEDDLQDMRVRLGAASRVEWDALFRKTAVPDDPAYGNQWHHEDMQSEAGWDLARTAPGQVVAVIDTGVELGHPDLESRLWVNPDEMAGNGLDDDGNGLVDDVNGYDFYAEAPDPQDSEGHGTAMAGLIGAAGDNGVGITGVCWDTRIQPLRFLDNFGYGAASDAVRAIAYAVEEGATVINASWGGSLYSDALYDAISAAETAGVLFVASAGNQGQDLDRLATYPAAFELPGILAVGSVNADGRLSTFSNFGGTQVDIAAPGNGVFSTAIGGGYARTSGTSPAAALVSGVAALVLEHGGALAPADLKARILQNATFDEGLAGRVLSQSRLNLYRALAGIPSRELAVRVERDRSVAFSGLDVVLTAVVDGPGPVEYQWFRDGVPIVGATNPKLVLPAAESGQSGRYSVRVGNSTGAVSSADMALTILDEAPKVRGLSPGYEGPAGRRFTLEVQVAGSVPMSYQWYRNGASLPGATAARLSVGNPGPGDSGTYTVRVVNAFGEALSRGVQVEIIDAPFPGWRNVNGGPALTRAAGLVWDGQAFVAAGDNGAILRSPNGIQWTASETGSGLPVDRILGEPGLSVLVQRDGPLLYSTDALAWQPVPWVGNTTDYSLFNFWDESRPWVALGSGELVVLYSGSVYRAGFDGQTFAAFQEVALPTDDLGRLESVHYASGKFLLRTRGAVASGEHFLVFDPVNEKWETLAEDLLVVSSTRDLFLSLAGQWSSDGLTWNDGYFDRVLYHDAISQESYLVFADGSRINGLDLTSNASPDTLVYVDDFLFSHVATNGEVTLALGDYGATARIVGDVRGEWTVRRSQLSRPIRSVVFGNGRFVALADDFDTWVLTSENGENWTTRGTLPIEPESIAFANGWFLAIGDFEDAVYRSRDGISWTTHASGLDLLSIRGVNRIFVATTHEDFYPKMLSSDGIHWVPDPWRDERNVYDLVYSEGRYLAFVQGNTPTRIAVYESAEGMDWRLLKNGYLNPENPDSSPHLETVGAGRFHTWLYWRLHGDYFVSSLSRMEEGGQPLLLAEPPSHNFYVWKVLQVGEGWLMGSRDGLFTSTQGESFPFQVASSLDNILQFAVSRDRLVALANGSLFVHDLLDLEYPSPPALEVEAPGGVVIGTPFTIRADLGELHRRRIQAVEFFVNGDRIGSTGAEAPAVQYLPTDARQLRIYATTHLRSGAMATSGVLPVNVQLPSGDAFPYPQEDPFPAYPILAGSLVSQERIVALFYSEETGRVLVSRLSPDQSWEVLAEPAAPDFTHPPRLIESDAGYLIRDEEENYKDDVLFSTDLVSWESREIHRGKSSIHPFGGVLWTSDRVGSDLYNVQKSSDGGLTWETTSTVSKPLLFADANHLFTWQLKASTDGVTWSDSFRDTTVLPLQHSDMRLMASHGTSLVAGTGTDTLYFFDGSDWSLSQLPQQENYDTVDQVAALPGLVLVGTRQGRLYATTDQGRSFSLLGDFEHRTGNHYFGLQEYLYQLGASAGYSRRVMADLALASIQVSVEHDRPGWLYVEGSVENRGFIDIPDGSMATVEMELSLNPGFLPAETLALEAASLVFDRSGGAMQAFSKWLPISTDLIPGEYFLRATLVPDPGVPDGNPGNHAIVVPAFTELGDQTEVQVRVVGDGRVTQEQRSPTRSVLTAEPAPGVDFLGWEGDHTSSDPMLEVELSGPLTLTARFGNRDFLGSFVLGRPLGDDWYFSPWFGVVFAGRNHWVFTEKMGWFHLYPLSQKECWLWLEPYGWFFVHTDYPFWLFWYEGNSWVRMLATGANPDLMRLRIPSTGEILELPTRD